MRLCCSGRVACHSEKGLFGPAADRSAHWQLLTNAGGPAVAARDGDQIKIPHVSFEGDKLGLEINRGLKSGRRLMDHLEVGMGQEQVQMALGSPIRKYREAKDGIDLQDWIYGQAPKRIILP